MRTAPLGRHMLLVGILVLAAFAPIRAAVASTRAPSQEAAIARCIRNAANGRKWLERTLWGLRDQEGGGIGVAIRNGNGSYDLGPLQINSWWVPKIAALLDRPPSHVRYWLRYDPCFNADAARWIFLTALAATRDYWRAVGLYHSPTEWRQRRYSASVARHLERRFGRDVFVRRARSDPR